MTAAVQENSAGPDRSAQPERSNHSGHSDQRGKFAKLLEKLQRSRPLRSVSHLSNQGGEVLSAGMSFQALFAVFAALWVGFSFFGIFLQGRPDLLDPLVKQIDTLVPGLIGENGAVDVQTILNGTTLSWSSVIAIASLLLLVITWFTSTRTAIRLLFDLDAAAYKNAILLKLRDLLLAVLFGALIIASAAITVIGSSLMVGLLEWFGFGKDSWLLGGAGAVLRYGLMFISYWFVLWAIHRWLAEVPLSRARLWIGCLPGAVGLLILTLLGTSILGGGR